MDSHEIPTSGPATPGSDDREIGSDFEFVESKYVTQSTSGRLPWEDSRDFAYVESGRQALALVEAELREQGHTHLQIPSYFCDSMISPFLVAGWTVTRLPVDNDLVVSPSDLVARVVGGVLLHAPYFGRQDSPAMLHALNALRRNGVVVIVDETHRLFSSPSRVADIRVASLRKLLPVYDGGYVSGLRPDRRIELLKPSAEVVIPRRGAMRAKSEALASRKGGKGHLALFAEAERLVEARTRPTKISDQSLELLRHLDIEKIRRARLANAVWLVKALGTSDRFRVINPPSENLLPSHLVLETIDARLLRQHLTARRIYCPIHWPPSRLLGDPSDWPARYLSLPIDHRYGEAEMLRLAKSVSAFFDENQE